MKSIFTIAFVWLFSTIASAQTDTVFHKLDSALKNGHIDSLRGTMNKTIDSMEHVNQKFEKKLEQVSRTTNLSLAVPDSVTSTLTRYSNKLDSVTLRLTEKATKVNDLKLPDGQYSKTIDSLNQINPLNKVGEAEQKIKGAQSDLNKTISKPLKPVNDKLNLLSKEAEGQGNLPGSVSTPNIKQDFVPGIPEMKLSSSGLPVSESILGTEKLNTDLSPDLNIGNLKTSAPMNDVQENLGKVSDISGKVSSYTEDAKNITSGNLDEVKELDKDVVSRLSSDDLKAAQGELDAGTQQIETIKAMGNKEAFKKQTLAKAREVVVAQLAFQQSKLAETVNKVSQHQKRAGTIFSKVKDLPKRPRKEKKPPLLERFVPGVTLQLQKTNFWYVDFNPTLRYRVRSIFSAGAGWNERIVFDKDFKFYDENRIYGIRSFYEVSILKGLWLRADIERMNAFVPISRSKQDIGERRHVWTYMAGVKKEFSFVPGVIGNVQFMYNLYDPKRTSPYFSRFNVRFGFEFPLKNQKTRK